MRKSLPWLLFLAFALDAACSAAMAQDTQAKIEQYMQASVKVDHFMGSTLVAQHDKIIVNQGYGMADVKAGIPNAPNTKFQHRLRDQGVHGHDGSAARCRNPDRALRS